MAVRRSTENLSGILNSMVLCTICNDTSGDTSVIETTCKHKFHRMCLSSWLDSNETCPNCRQPCAQALVRNAASDRRSGVQGNQGLPPPPNTGTVPKPRINTRSQARGNSNSQAFRSNPRRDSVSAKPPDASDSSAMTEERIQRLISQSLDSYRDSMAAMISEQITAAVRNLNLAPPRQESHDEPQLEWENDIAPSFPRLSSVSNMRMRDDANSSRPPRARVMPNDVPIERPDRLKIFVGSIFGVRRVITESRVLRWIIKHLTKRSSCGSCGYCQRIHLPLWQYPTGHVRHLFVTAGRGAALGYWSLCSAHSTHSFLVDWIVAEN
ncbi:hypothetical protein ACLKA6_017341 [Drosophila palustris]